MSITRAQIARQLLAEGGSPGNTTRQRVLPRADGKRPGYYGSDAGFGSDDYKDESASFDSGSGSGGSDQDFANARASMYGTSPELTQASDFLPSRAKKNLTKTAVSLISLNPVVKYGINKKIEEDYKKNRQIGEDVITAMMGGQQYFGPVNQPMMSSYAKTTGLKGPTGPINNGGDDNMIIPPIFRSAQLPSDIESRPSDFDLYAALEGREASRFGANPNNMTGAMQRFSDGGEVRQAYGLGSFVKKIKGGVKKVGRGLKKFAKSKAGKAALLYAGGSFLGSLGSGNTGFDRLRPENLGYLKDKAMEYVPSLSSESSNKITGSSVSEIAEKYGISKDKAFEYLKKNETTAIPNLVKYGIPAAMGASYLFAKNEQPDDLDAEINQNYKDTSGLKELYAQFPEYRFQVPEQYRLANGGRIGYDMGGDVEMASYGYDDAMNETRELFMQYKKSGIVPMEMEFEEFLELLQGSKQKEEPNRVMAQEGGIMNLGGLEKDYREGGFVPIGEYEKKDDVPARLSKNEFVFTADAVRAAGGGSVDKGADLMYKTMKNLESRVG